MDLNKIHRYNLNRPVIKTAVKPLELSLMKIGERELSPKRVNSYKNNPSPIQDPKINGNNHHVQIPTRQEKQEIIQVRTFLDDILEGGIKFTIGKSYKDYRGKVHYIDESSTPQQVYFRYHDDPSKQHKVTIIRSILGDKSMESIPEVSFSSQERSQNGA